MENNTIGNICQEIIEESMGGVPQGLTRQLKGGRQTPMETPVSKAYKHSVIGTPGFNGYDQALGNGNYAYEQEEDINNNIINIIKDLESELDPSTLDGRSGLMVLGKLRKRLKL